MGNVGIRSTGPATSCDRNDDTVTPAPPESHGTHRTSGDTVECDRAEHTGTDTVSASEQHPDQAVQEAKRKVVSFQLPPSADDGHVSWLRLRYHETVARLAHTEWLRRTVPVLANALLAAGEVTPSNRTRSDRGDRSRRRAPYRARPLARISRRRWNQKTLVSETQLLKTSWPVRQTEQLFLPAFPVDERRDRRYGNRVHVANGAFGRVFQVCESAPAEQTTHPSRYALKVYRKSDIVYSDAVQQLVDEVNIQTICGHHPFIVRCVDFWQSRTHIFLLSNYYGNGELFQRLKTFCSELSRLYVAELALAIDFLHNAGIIYRDLKPENILLDDDYHIKLIDFGLSKWLRIGSRTSTLCGTVQYMDLVVIDGRRWDTVATMNARSQTFDLRMEGRQVDEAVSSIFHTILFHRSLGKFMYTGEAMYSIGTIGYRDVDCDFIDFTYVCCMSPLLEQKLRHEIGNFSRQLRSNDSGGTGQISLEFFQRKKTRWPFQTDCIPWEVWTIRLELMTLTNEDDRLVCRERVSDMLTDKIFCITEIMNRHDYVPKIPNQAELDMVFDTSYPDVQPYLFQFKFSTAGPTATSVSSTMKKLIKETLSL